MYSVLTPRGSSLKKNSSNVRVTSSGRSAIKKRMSADCIALCQVGITDNLKDSDNDKMFHVAYIT